MPSRSLTAATALTGLVALLGGCAALGSAWEYITTERPPYPLRAIELTSDARIDTSGVLIGTFAGSGTDERVTLLSSDTGFIAALAREYRPGIDREGRDLWSTLARMGTVIIPVDRARAFGRSAVVEAGRVASPHGHSNVLLEAVRLRGSSCGWRGARAEMVVSGPVRGSRAPSLRGPVVGSFRPGQTSDANQWRDPPPRLAAAAEEALIARTARDMDSVLALRLPRSSTPLGVPTDRRLLQDPLEDIDAVEVAPLWAGQGRVRYAVALRERRTTPRGEVLLASAVMIWDAEGTWRQSVLAPTVVELRRGQLRPYAGASMLPLYWRRLDGVSGFGLDRDYLFLEQVDVEAQSVLWGAIEARSNNLVAAVEVGGACVDDDDQGRWRVRDR
ncbi:MAG: hypothetical protein ABJB33_08535 [Gemmatimonadota bacterium]